MTDAIRKAIDIATQADLQTAAEILEALSVRLDDAEYSAPGGMVYVGYVEAGRLKQAKAQAKVLRGIIARAALSSSSGFDEGVEAAISAVKNVTVTKGEYGGGDFEPGESREYFKLFNYEYQYLWQVKNIQRGFIDAIRSLRSTTAGEQCLWPSCKDVCPPSDMTCTRSMVEPLPETPGLRVRDLPKARSTTAGERELGWRCFHCDEVFITVEAAIEHFGPHELCQAGCQIDLAEYRRMEEVHQQHLTETDEASRTFYAMRADHRQALIREEEKGYTRGVKDAREEATAGERDDRRDGAD